MFILPLVISKYFYYFVVCIVLIYNYKLVSDYNMYNEKLKDIEKSENVQVNKDVVSGVDYLHNVGNSEYIHKIEKINVSNNKTTITFNINKNDDYKKMVENTEEILGKKSNNKSIENDKKMIVEFE